MNTTVNFRMRRTHQFLILVLLGLFVTGCANVGGKQLSLLTSSEILDPLEVPPGMSPLPEEDQFSVPSVGNADPARVSDISPEQFRNYATWIEFEQYKKFREQDQGIGLDSQAYRQALERGEGNFKVTVAETDQGTNRLRVVDSIESVWLRMAPVLNDLGVTVLDADEETMVYRVKDIPVKNPPKLSERFGFREYTGRIDELHLVTASANHTEVIPKTEFNVEVDANSSQDFLTRLRYFLLTNYQQNAAVTQLASLEVRKRFDLDEDGRQYIVLSEQFGTAWGMIGRTIEASGMRIVELDRNQGLYVVTFSTVVEDKKKFRLAFWRKREKEIADKQFQILVAESGGQTTVRVQQPEGEEPDAESAERLLGILYDRIFA